jgi:hypothetical protein
MKKEITTPAGCRPYPTEQELKEERKKIKAELKEMKMTRKKFSERCKEVKAAAELTREAKAEKIEYLSTLLIEDNTYKFPEMRDWSKRESKAMEKYAGHGGFSYCTVCGAWSPHRPPAIAALDREWRRIFDRLVAEERRKALMPIGKAA